MSHAFQDRTLLFPSSQKPQPAFVAEVAPALARGGGSPPGDPPAGGRHACASDEADFLLQVTGALVALRAAIARWRATPRGASRNLRRRAVERSQEALVALLWGASRARLSHNEWRVVERLLAGVHRDAGRRPGGEHADRIALA